MVPIGPTGSRWSTSNTPLGHRRHPVANGHAPLSLTGASRTRRGSSPIRSRTSTRRARALRHAASFLLFLVGEVEPPRRLLQVVRVRRITFEVARVVHVPPPRVEFHVLGEGVGYHVLLGQVQWLDLLLVRRLDETVDAAN